jgi:hypothetical protein
MIELKSFIILVIIVISLSYILLKKVLPKQKTQSNELDNVPDINQDDKSLSKEEGKSFSYFIKAFGWLLILVWLLAYISPSSLDFIGPSELGISPSEFDIKYPEGYPSTVSFKHMVVKPLVSFIDDIYYGYIVDAIMTLIFMLTINSPFIIGLAIIFPKLINRILNTIYFPFKKIILFLKRFSIKKTILLLENNFGFGLYRILVILWCLSVITSLVLGIIDDDDYFIIFTLLLILYWPVMISVKRAYNWIREGFNRDTNSDK